MSILKSSQNKWQNKFSEMQQFIFKEFGGNKTI